jgi:tetratricopeptide (TPR) repeat protein
MCSWSLSQAKEYYEQAFALDPKFALGWCGLAQVYFQIGSLGYMPPIPAYAQARQAALKALEIDETLAEAHTILGMLHASDYDWKSAEREFRRSMELDPNSGAVVGNYNYYYLLTMGRLDEAVAAAQRFLERDPLAPSGQWHLGICYYYKRQWDRAIRQCRNALELDPNSLTANFILSLAYRRVGNIEGAILALESALQMGGYRPPLILGALGFIYAEAGRIGEARKILEELQALAKKQYVSPSSFGDIYMGLGETDRAFDWMEKAVEEHDGMMLHLNVSPDYDSLRSHPRYHALLRKMNLE